MKKYWSLKKILFVFAIIIISLVIPFIINELYLKNDGYVTVWDGKDLLLFYGDVLGVVATIIGVYFTIDYSIYKKFHEESLMIKPILSTEYSVITNNNDFSQYDTKTTYLHVHSDDKIVSQKMSVPYLIKKAISVSEKYIKEKDLEESKNLSREVINFIGKYYLLQYTIYNMGAGNIIAMKVDINNNNCLRNIALKTDEAIILKIILDMSGINENEKKDFRFDFEYTDIYNRITYSQNETIRVIRLGEIVLESSQSIEQMLSKQEVI